MKLVDLICHFRHGGSFDEFCRVNAIDSGAEGIEVLMKRPLAADSDLRFLEFEKSDGKSLHEFNGFTYESVFDSYYFLDVIEESNSGISAELTDDEIALILLNYAINDA